MSQHWIILAALVLGLVLFGAQVYAVVKVATRLTGLFRGFAKPGKLAELLSPETHAMLVRRGIDPASLTGDFDELRDAPEIRERVAADVRAALTGVFRVQGAKRVPTSHEETASGDEHRPMPFARPAPESLPTLPEAFDAAQRGNGRTVAIALGAGLTVVVLARLLGWA